MVRIKIICAIIHPVIATPPEMAQLYRLELRCMLKNTASRFTPPTIVVNSIPGIRKSLNDVPSSRLIGRFSISPSGLIIINIPERVEVTAMKETRINRSCFILFFSFIQSNQFSKSDDMFTHRFF